MDCMSLSALTTFGASRFYVRKTANHFSKSIKYSQSLKEDLCFGYYFRVVRHESETSCSEFDILTKDPHALRQQHASSIKLYTSPLKKIQIAVAGPLMYTQVLLYTHLHSSDTSTLMYYSDRCQPVGPVTQCQCPPGPDSDADESRRDESRQSRTVTTATWMSHGSHAPDRMRKLALYQCPC